MNQCLEMTFYEIFLNEDEYIKVQEGKYQKEKKVVKGDGDQRCVTEVFNTCSC